MEDFELAYKLYEPPEPVGGALVESAVLYLDSLGVKVMSCTEPIRIQDEDKPKGLGLAPASAERHLRRLREAVVKASSRSEMDRKIGRHATVCFTDNVVVGVPVAPFDKNHDAVVAEAILMAGRYSWAFSVDGQSTRGALTFGPHFMAPGFAFGPALVRAAKMEEERLDASGGYPACVRVDQSILDATAEPLHALHGALWTFGEFCFVSPLDVIEVSAWFQANTGTGRGAIVSPGDNWHEQVREWVTAVRERNSDGVPKASWVAGYTEAWLKSRPDVGIPPEFPSDAYAPLRDDASRDWCAVTRSRLKALEQIAASASNARAI
jgi:hypothetical protein